MAWANRRRSPKDFVWLLSVLGELTCYTPCQLEHRGGFGNIGGRKGGLKDFLAHKVPDLLPKYKSISRYATLAFRLKRAFNIFPPAALSLMHPDLPLPERNMPFLTNHARKVFRDHFAALRPEYKAYDAVVRDYEAVKPPSKYEWRSPLPQSQWAAAENHWRLAYIRRPALQKIRADHSFYARDYLSPEYFMREGDHLQRPRGQWDDEAWCQD